MSTGLRRRLARWLEAGRTAGFLVLLVAGSAALGIAISLPLWLFATSAREAYTIAVLALGVVGIVYLVVRSAVRRGREAARDPRRPRRSTAAGLFTAFMVIVGVGGLYLAAALLARANWILAAADLAVWAGLLWALGRARGAARSRKARPLPAENKGR